MTKLIYAVPDLHGRYDLLEKVVDTILKYDMQFKNSKIVFLGDYVDRGPNSKKVIDYLMFLTGNLKQIKCICLKGNHDKVLVDIYNGRLSEEQIDQWADHGLIQTLFSYDPNISRIDLSVIPKEHIEWLDSLPVIKVTKHHIFVHAGVDPNHALDKQDIAYMLWKRYEKDENSGYKNYHIVRGHQGSIKGPNISDNRSDLDTYAFHTGRIPIAIYEVNTPGKPIHLMEVM